MSSALFQVAGWGAAEKRNIKASASLVTLWTPLIRGNISLEDSKLSHTLHVASTCGKHNLSLSAALNNTDKVSGDSPSVGGGGCLYFTYLNGPNEFAKGLSKRQVMLKITHERPKSPTAELELEAAIEVLRWDDRMYQTSATLQLRSALTPMRLRCLVTVDAANFHVTQTAPPDLPSHSPPAGDLNCGPPERPLHPGVKSPFPQQRRARPRPHSGVPTTESFCESANAALTKQQVGVFYFIYAGLVFRFVLR